MHEKAAGLYILAAFRTLTGWIMLWPFFDKMFGLGFQTPHGGGWIDGVSPSSYVVYLADGVFKDLYVFLAGNLAIDIVMMASLLVLGVSLILGVASKLTTFGMCAFLLVMYSIHVPPSDNPVVDYHILLVLGILAVYALGGYEKLSLHPRWRETKMVRRFPILE
ncbi:MAG: hypothetical protein IKP20_04850 [Candidatus Methanomethylophilaceae archaeon]|nr:hypothetical protein [Candidatus Methanomethylophilaceae archaeon]